MLLLIDDELKLLKLLGMILRQEGFEVLEASSARSGLQMLEHQPVEVVLSDVRLPDSFGVELVAQYKKMKPEAEVILMTAYGNIPDGIQAMKNGAFDYIVKGDDNDKIIPLVHLALEKAAKNRKKNTHTTTSHSKTEIIGSSPAIVLAKKLADKVAPKQAAVLLTGETGTGKEVFARYIHEKSGVQGKFIAVNCAAFSGDLLESELFGHKKGAFTGAVADKKGLVEEAENGTLFLDELGEMPQALQPKLLRLLESGEYIKMGESKVSRANFRLISATNRDLESEIARGNFRQDLFFRLNVFGIHLPPLRERKEDIRPLAENFIKRFCAEMDTPMPEISPSFYHQLAQAHWPGNIRELRNALERALILMENGQLEPISLPENIAEDSAPSLTMSDVERQHIKKILNHTGGNKSEAARLLGIGIATLYRKLDEYGLR